MFCFDSDNSWLKVFVDWETNNEPLTTDHCYAAERFCFCFVLIVRNLYNGHCYSGFHDPCCLEQKTNVFGSLDKLRMILRSLLCLRRRCFGRSDLACVRACVRTYVRACVRACVRTYVLTITISIRIIHGRADIILTLSLVEAYNSRLTFHGRIYLFVRITTERLIHRRADIILTFLLVEGYKETRQKRLVEHRKYNLVLTLSLVEAYNKESRQMRLAVKFGQTNLLVRKKFTSSLLIPTCTYIRTNSCLLYTSPSPRDRQKSRMPSSA